MFPSFPRYKEGTGGRGQIEPGPPVVEPEPSRRFNLLFTVEGSGIQGNQIAKIAEEVPNI